MAALLIRTPQRFDVILIPNVFGDILSDEASELAGGLGLAASLNQGDRCSVANAGHGSAPDIAGRDIANPASLMLSAAMLFEHLGSARGEDRWRQAATCLTSAVDHNLGTPQTRTRDLGGALSTTAFAETVVQTIRKGG